MNKLEVCPFQKHEGEKWEDVVAEDRRYVEWLVSAEGPALSTDLYEKLTELLEETAE